MGFKGNVESFNLADVFQNLASNQQTGTLRVYANNGEEKNVFFQTGQVRHLSKGTKANLVTGEVFLARGLVARPALESANDRQKESGRAIGACLIDLGHINQEQLDDVTRHQIEEEIFDLFSWDHANFEFSDGTPQSLTTTGVVPNNGPALPISHLIMEAARRVDEWERLRKLVPQYKEIYSMDVAVRRAIETGEMEMDPVEKRVASMIDGARDVDDLIEDSALFKFEVVNALAGFVQSSLIRPANSEELRLAEEDCARQNLPRRRIKVLERILALGGENPKIRRDLAEMLARAGETERACIHFSVLADAEIQASREDSAVEMYKRILSISPRHVKAHEQLAAIQARRGKKREAFTHYHELFDLFREQNHMREARAAAACALDCEPANGDLRLQLVELLLADKQNDAASQQLELLGDQAARQNNVKAASDSYRRAMQFRPGNKQLKKKLADAMLTKEDRRSRKQKLYTVVGLLVVAGIAGGILSLIEKSNAAKLQAADDNAKKIAEQAAALEHADKYPEAQAEYTRAGDVFNSLKNLFSPIMGYASKATDHAKPFYELSQKMAERGKEKGESARVRAKKELDEVISKGPTLLMYERRDTLERIIKNEYADEDDKHRAGDELAKVNAEIAEFDEGKARLAKDPAVEFPGLDQETAFKRQFWTRFKRYLGPDDVKLPVLIKPNADDITVYVDGKYKGVVSQAMAENEQNTFRLSIVPTHKFEFKKPGYRTVTMNTADLPAALFVLKLEREPSFRLELRSADPSIVLTSEVLVYNNTLIVGAENGSLLQIGDPDKPIARRYDIPNLAAALNKDVIGRIYPCPRPDKSDLLIYTTRAGDVIAVDTAGQKFTEAFKLQVKSGKNANISLSPQTPPVLSKLKIYGEKPVLVVPDGQFLHLVDCEKGLQMPSTHELRTAATSAPLCVEQNSMIVIGCGDGNVYGVEIGKEANREYSTNRAAAVLGRPVIAEDKLIVGTADGSLYFFEASKPTDKRPESFEIGGSLDAEPLVFNRRVYVGSTLKDGFSAVDIPSRKKLFARPYPGMGNVQFAAVANNNCVYFCTDTGRFYCVDTETGAQRWSYVFPENTKFSSPPVLIGNRVYCFTKNGIILGFDEAPGN